jgi:ketosteroid isomerase-like protein
MIASKLDPLAVVDRLLGAINDHDLEAMVACFDEGYVNETPIHPKRGFRGRDQVRKNWTQIFGTVPQLQAQLIGTAVDGDTVWTEWHMSGGHRDGAPFEMAGIVIFRVPDTTIASARFYLEPVEQTSGDVNAAVRQLLSEEEAP